MSGQFLLRKSTDTVFNEPKGRLIFSCDFESGNLDSVDEIAACSEYDLLLRADSNNPRYRVWFYFSVRNVKRKQIVTFNITNFSKGKSLYRDGMTPLVKCTSRPTWQRTPARNAFYYRCPRHRDGYVLSFAFEFDDEAATYFFAYSYPYTYTDLQEFLHSLDRAGLPFYRRGLLCRTLQHRRLDVITVGPPPASVCADTPAPAAAAGRPPGGTAAAAAAAAAVPRRTVFISARVHPGESPASFMCHGLLEFLVSDDPTAAALRREATFVVVPMLNPDGVFRGNYRCSLAGDDLNRQWGDPSPWVHPENYAVKRLLARLSSDPAVSLDVVIDLHAHSTSLNAFCFVNLVLGDPARMQRELAYPRVLDGRSQAFSLLRSRVCDDPSKHGTGRRSLPEVLEDHTHVYTLEASFFGFQPTAGVRVSPFTQQGYLDLGRDIAAAFADYYRIR